MVFRVGKKMNGIPLIIVTVCFWHVFLFVLQVSVALHSLLARDHVIAVALYLYRVGPSCMANRIDVLVVGGGLAGVSAARVLTAFGLHALVV